MPLWFNKIQKDFYEINLEVKRLTQGRYPDFVKAKRPTHSADHIPVFMFHTIDPGIFEDQLNFLKTNGYRTITCDEFYQVLAGKTKIPPKSVLLTIDDGKISVWIYAYPLLKKYGFQATVFLIPGYMEASGPYIPNLEDLWAGKCQPQDIKNLDRTFNPLLNWEQVSEMYNSGIIDFQCHTLYHHKIYTGKRIVDFFNPFDNSPIYNIPLPKNWEIKLKSESKEQFFGMPVYENSPLMLGRARYLNDLKITEKCIQYVREQGIEFFQKKFWRSELFLVAQNMNGNIKENYQSAEATFKEIYYDLSEAKNLIEKNLPGHKVRHLCYPYGTGSEVAVECSKRAGYLTNFWVTHVSRSSNKAGDDPFYCTRLKDDYIYRLPGVGRKNLSEIILMKLKRRIMRMPLY